MHESKEAFLHHENSSTVSALAVAGCGSGSGRHDSLRADNKCTPIDEDGRGGPSPLNATIGGSSRAAPPPNYSNRRCTLTCCAPDGSPLQGKSFIVSPDGAVMGRKFTNSIALFMKVIDGDGEERIVNVDTAISSEHARVEFDDRTGRFFICDGTATKSSTNGTWYRLSGPHQESPPHVLQSGAEVLIGTVRFQVRAGEYLLLLCCTVGIHCFVRCDTELVALLLELIMIMIASCTAGARDDDHLRAQGGEQVLFCVRRLQVVVASKLLPSVPMDVIICSQTALSFVNSNSTAAAVEVVEVYIYLFSFIA